jgi:hypothetical protein
MTERLHTAVPCRVPAADVQQALAVLQTRVPSALEPLMDRNLQVLSSLNRRQSD